MAALSPPIPVNDFTTRAPQNVAVAYDNGVEFARSTFEVGTLGEEFVQGASGECTIENFPSTGESATFAWNQNTQHLELVPETDGGGGGGGANVATTADLAEVKAALKADIAAVKVEIAALESRLHRPCGSWLPVSWA